MMRKVWRNWRRCNFFPCRKKDCKFFKKFIPWIKIIMILKPKFGLHISRMYEVCHNRSFFLTLALTSKTCLDLSLFGHVWTCHYWICHNQIKPHHDWKFNPNLIKIVTPYTLPMGSWLRICASTIIGITSVVLTLWTKQQEVCELG